MRRIRSSVNEPTRVRGGGLLVLVVALLYPVIRSSPYGLSIGVDIGVMAIGVVGVTAAVGGAGQLNLGQGGFMTIGGFSVAYLTTTAKFPFVVGALLGIFGAVIAGAVVGYIALRLEGNYLAMATLAAGWIIYSLVLATKALGGSEGFGSIPAPKFGKFVISSPLQQYWVVWVVVLSSYAAAWGIFRSHVGHELRAIRDDETAARCVGINITLRKVQIFAFSALLGGVAGAIDAAIQSAIDPNLFGPSQSFLMFVLAVVGGLGSLAGGIVAASMYVWLTQEVPGTGNYAILALGLVAVLVVATLPTGLGGLGRSVFDWARNRILKDASRESSQRLESEQLQPVVASIGLAENPDEGRQHDTDGVGT